MSKVICIGESLIDFLPTDSGGLNFVAKAGGAPSNVCACVAKLGGNGYYLGKLSTDNFSVFLLDKMRGCGINTHYVVIDERYNTALAIVTLSKDGDRKFSFYRQNTCDLMLDEKEIKEEMFDKGDILHFCSVGLVESPSKYAHIKAIEFAKKKSCLISFDVNLRFGLWNDLSALKSTVKQFLGYADLLKVTDEELEFITDQKEESLAIQQLFQLSPQCKLIFVTKGSKGVSVYDRQLNSFSQNAISVNVVDTTGAGDCFSGCILYNIANKGILLNLNDIKQAVEFASYGCAVVIGKKGAMEAMPTLEEIQRLKGSKNE